ncbi:MAG: aldehyde dehydrogenase family protein, partial [Rhizobiales bacterium]|nr:aldehyde dehydrogenase family protein [Hyphomicrobiales bacterium]
PKRLKSNRKPSRKLHSSTAQKISNHSTTDTHFMLANEMPHGGVKQSGYGKDMSMYSLEDYTAVRHVMIAH